MQDSSDIDLDAALTLCDREPIHIPGAIQPYGLLLIAEARTLAVLGCAGDIEARLAAVWQGRPLSELLGQDLARIGERIADQDSLALQPVATGAETFDVSAHASGDYILVDLEPTGAATTVAQTLATVDAAGRNFERAHDLIDLCETAARLFRDLTGYDRVMVYRFQEDAAGIVVAEARDEKLGAFLNHQFPATDIPSQARALYVRNRIRVIPDVDYVPAPIRAAGDWAGAPTALGEIDLSDCSLRSVSPIHIQYLKNMGVAASASVSIVKDGLLWGLIACHHNEAKAIPLATRLACKLLAGSLSRQIQAKDEAELYRERIRLRTTEDSVMSLYDPDMRFEDFVDATGPELQRLLGADGLAVVSGTELRSFGHCPQRDELRAIGRWVGERALSAPVQTDRLSEIMPQATQFLELASGLMAITLSTETPTQLLWLRAEKPQLVEWAGNPHKASEDDPTAVLTPRGSFKSWVDEVRGRSRPWSIAEAESAVRIARLLRERRQALRLRELNRELTRSVEENEHLLQQKGFLLREVNHRVQNSLQLVSAFLKMQSREIADETSRAHLTEAQRRLTAVALVHRRLYTGESVEIVDLGRYLEDLLGELQATMDPGWANRMRLDLAPVQVKADRAVHVGLVMTELVINAQKYAYGGDVGPLAISLDQHLDRFRLIVADRGAGKTRTRQGFGSKMMTAMVAQIGGALDEEDNRPGLRTTVSAAVD